MNHQEIAARGGTDQAPAIIEALQEAMEIFRSPRRGPGAHVLEG